MKSKNLKISLIVLLAIAILWYIKPKSENTDASKMQGKQGAAQSSNVTAYIVKAEKLDNKIVASGTVLANEEVVLVPEVAGKIVSLNLKEGDKITKGDLLVKINDADLQAQLKKLKFQEKLAAENEARAKKLLNANGLSQVEYDATLTQLNSTKADIELTQAQIAKTEIHAPFSGTVGLRNVSEGSYVTPATLASSAIKIASLQQIDPVKIDFSIPEKYATVVKKGDVIIFTIQGNDEKYKGNIYAIEPKIDLTTRTVSVRAVCPNKEGKIFPGVSAKIELTLKQIDGALMIPTEAIIPELKGKKVFLCKNGKAQSQKVETGIRTDSKIQITDGLQAGDTVITTGIMQLKDGGVVKILTVK